MASTSPDLATILVQRREALGLTPVAAARLSGVSLGGLRNIESGRRPTPRFLTVVMLARAYQMLRPLGRGQHMYTLRRARAARREPAPPARHRAATLDYRAAAGGLTPIRRARRPSAEAHYPGRLLCVRDRTTGSRRAGRRYRRRETVVLLLTQLVGQLHIHAFGHRPSPTARPVRSSGRRAASILCAARATTHHPPSPRTRVIRERAVRPRSAPARSAPPAGRVAASTLKVVITAAPCPPPVG
jgi:hypothetical protein